MKIQEPNLQVEQVFLRLPCSLWWMDRDHNYLGCNIETCAALRASSPDEILGKTMIEIAEAKELSEFKAKSIYDTDERIMQTGVAEFQIKNMVPPPIGEQSIRQLGAKQPIFNKEKEVIGLLGVAIFDHDIGKEFKEPLELLSRGDVDQFRMKNQTVNLGFKEAFQMMPCSLFWMNREHIYLGCNLECCRHVQVESPYEIIGKTAHGIVAMKRWSESKAKNLSDLDEFIMRTGVPEFNIEFILPQEKKEPSLCQWASKKAIFNDDIEIIGLMGAGMYDGQFGIPTKTSKVS